MQAKIMLMALVLSFVHGCATTEDSCKEQVQKARMEEKDICMAQLLLAEDKKNKREKKAKKEKAEEVAETETAKTPQDGEPDLGADQSTAEPKVAEPETTPEGEPEKSVPANRTKAEATGSGRVYLVKSALLNVRSGPSTEFSVVRVLRANEEVNEMGREGQWLKIAEGEYVSLSFLKDQ